jgi:hypothetical protein
VGSRPFRDWLRGPSNPLSVPTGRSARSNPDIRDSRPATSVGTRKAPAADRGLSSSWVRGSSLAEVIGRSARSLERIELARARSRRTAHAGSNAGARAETLEDDLFAAALADPVGASAHAVHGPLELGALRTHACQKRSYLRSFEAAGRSIWVVFVIGRRTFGRTDDVVEGPRQRFDPRARLRDLSGQEAVELFELLRVRAQGDPPGRASALQASLPRRQRARALDALGLNLPVSSGKVCPALAVVRDGARPP